LLPRERKNNFQQDFFSNRVSFFNIFCLKIDSLEIHLLCICFPLKKDWGSACWFVVSREKTQMYNFVRHPFLAWVEDRVVVWGPDILTPERLRALMLLPLLLLPPPRPPLIWHVPARLNQRFGLD
jgi:hypothetical protein